MCEDLLEIPAFLKREAGQPRRRVRDPVRKLTISQPKKRRVFQRGIKALVRLGWSRDQIGRLTPAEVAYHIAAKSGPASRFSPKAIKED